MFQSTTMLYLCFALLLTQVCAAPKPDDTDAQLEALKTLVESMKTETIKRVQEYFDLSFNTKLVARRNQLLEEIYAPSNNFHTRYAKIKWAAMLRGIETKPCETGVSDANVKANAIDMTRQGMLDLEIRSEDIENYISVEAAKIVLYLSGVVEGAETYVKECVKGPAACFVGMTTLEELQAEFDKRLEEWPKKVKAYSDLEDVVAHDFQASVDEVQSGVDTMINKYQLCVESLKGF